MRYERVRLLGKGATAETLLCRDNERGGRLVAQKIFRPEWVRERPDLIDHEFRTLAGLSHPYIVSIEDFGEEISEGAECSYLVSEYVEGEPLLDFLRDGDLNKTVWLFLQFLEALDYLYFRNIVHLDLKPQNVLVQRESGSRGPCVKVIDFGLASPTLGKGTSQTEAIGTPPYTAPEFALRRPVDTRSDLYSVGVLLYRALAGRSPFDGKDPVALLNQQLSRDPIPLTSVAKGIPAELACFVHRLLERDPAKRFETPRAALAALGEAIGESFPVARVVPIPIFDDPDLVFRRDEFSGLIKKILSRGGLWAIRGGKGMGKTFLLRWLERSLWKERVPVMTWSGERVVLSEGAKGPEAGESTVLIDDADEGPVKEWILSRGYRNAVVLGERLDRFNDPGWERVELGPLNTGEVGGIFQTLFGNIPGTVAKKWTEVSRGIPRDLVQFGRELVRRGVVRKKGAVWEWDKAKGLGESAPLEEGTERLLRLLTTGRISLDSEMLALWTDRSVAEVEETIQWLLKEGLLERTIQSGRPRYRLIGETSWRKGAAARGKREDLLKVLQTLYDEGRYLEGVELLEGFGGKVPPSLRLAKAKLLWGAGLQKESQKILGDDLLTELSPPEIAEVWEVRGKSWLASGKTAEAARAFEEALVRYEREKDRGGTSRVLLHLGILHQRMGAFEKAKGRYDEALAAAGEARQSGLLQGAAELNLANLLYDGSKWEEADRLYRQSLGHLGPTRHVAVTAQATLNYATLSFYMGRPLQAAHLCREALRLAVDHRYLLTQGRALLLLAMIDENQGSLERGGERLLEAVAIFERAGLQFEEAQARIHRSYFLESAGELAAAEGEARQALVLTEKVDASDLAAQARLILGKVLGRLDRTGEGRGNIEAAQRHFGGSRNLSMSWECDFERGELERRSGDQKAAAVWYRKALETVEDVTRSLPPTARESFLRDRKRERILKILEELGGAS